MQPAALYLIGVVALSAIGVGALVAMEWLRPEGYNSAVVGQIIGLIGPSIIGLMVLLRSVHNGQALEEVKQTTNEVKHTAKRAAEKAEAAASVIAVAAGVPADVMAEVVGGPPPATPRPVGP